MPAQNQGIDFKTRINKISPGASRAQLGSLIYDMVAAINDLQARYALLLAHIDAGAVAGLGTSNVTNYKPTLPAVVLPEAR